MAAASASTCRRRRRCMGVHLAVPGLAPNWLRTRARTWDLQINRAHPDRGIRPGRRECERPYTSWQRMAKPSCRSRPLRTQGSVGSGEDALRALLQPRVHRPLPATGDQQYGEQYSPGQVLTEARFAQVGIGNILATLPRSSAAASSAK